MILTAITLVATSCGGSTLVSPAPPGGDGLEGRPRVTGGDEARTVEIDGRIAALDERARTLVVGDRTIGVDERTVARDGNQLYPLADLSVGDRVRVRGGIDTDAEMFLAREIRLQPGS